MYIQSFTVFLQNILFATVDKKGYDSPMVLRNVTFYGFQNKPSGVVLNENEQKFDYDEELKVCIKQEQVCYVASSP